MPLDADRTWDPNSVLSGDEIRAAIADGTAVLTPPSDAVKNMAVIDAIYVAAGMLPRQPTQ